jgi:ABC-type branched-subunit amino acid transport system substrate-binding protein
MMRMAGEEAVLAREQAEAMNTWPTVAIAPAQALWVRSLTISLLAVVGFASGMLIWPTTPTVSASVPTTTKLPKAEMLNVTPLALPRGVTKDSITMGMSSPFSGSAKSLSEGMKLGIETAFSEINAAGGINGRRLNLIALDNGYEEKRALETTKDLVENRHVFGLIGSVGTPTVKAVLPYVNAAKVLLFGPLTGSPVTRTDPPDRYVFNVRTSYAAETEAMVKYLLDVKHIAPRSIVMFAQNDAFGDAGYEGAVKTLRKRGHSGDLLRVGYDRNTVDVADAVTRLLAYNGASSKSGGVRAVIVVATATASAALTARIEGIGAIVLNVSFVDASQLALEFKDHWPGVGNGVIVTQVVPHYESGATGVIRYREALKTFYPDRTPGFASLEGYVVGSLFAEGIRRAGPAVDTEHVVDALEKIQDLDLGTGTAFSFGVSKHQATPKVWGTVLTSTGFKPLDSEWME